MPISFKLIAETSGMDIEACQPLNRAIIHLAGLFREAGSLRFRKSFVWKVDAVVCYSHCSQHKDNNLKSKEMVNRNRFKMIIFSCEKTLNFNFNFKGRLLNIKLSQSYCTKYVGVYPHTEIQSCKVLRL